MFIAFQPSPMSGLAELAKPIGEALDAFGSKHY